MLRHSASQIFGSKHPALTRASADDDRTPPPAWMWGVTSGNSRMLAQQQQQPQQDLPQAQTQTQHAAEQRSLQPYADPSLFAPGPSMPLGSASAYAGGPPQTGEARDIIMALADDSSASSLHPVFFTERLHRSAFALDAASVTSPVAHGYVYHENQRRADGAIPAML